MTFKLIHELIIKARGNPALAVPCLGLDDTVYWAFPKRDVIYAVNTKTKKVGVADCASLFINDKPISHSDFPPSPPVENWELEIKLAQCSQACIVHNAASVLAWYKNTIQKLKGVLLPSDRKQLVYHANQLETSLRQMAYGAIDAGKQSAVLDTVE